MKAKVSRNLLESALSKCFDACERQSGDSFTQFSFANSTLTLSSKGTVAFYEETIDTISASEDGKFSIKTPILLEFVKHVSTEDVTIEYNSEKESCIVYSDKKTKIELQVSDIVVINDRESTYKSDFKIENPSEFIAKLNYATKFCANESPNDSVNLLIENNKLTIRSISGPTFFSTEMSITSNGETEIFLPKKSPSIIKNIFSDNLLEKFSFNKFSVLLESSKCKLVIYLSKDTNETFPVQILQWVTKDATATLKVSSNELNKSLRFFNGVFSKGAVEVSASKGELNIECKENQMNAKENVIVEEIEGEASSKYVTKFLLDCLESMQSPWVNLSFIKLQESQFICKITSGNTVTIICPTVPVE
jgi:DNA polymerase III sliding clamp (beta) subunit (PCNA family)